jgi:HEPN domain-containing protein
MEGPQGPGPTREARIQRARAWLRHASRDLSAAQLLLEHTVGQTPRAAPFQVAFHAQQAAEKALKGALTYAGVRFEDTHRLNTLAGLLPLDWETHRLSTTLGELNRYAVQARYPDLAEPEPAVEDARRAIAQALSVQQTVVRDLKSHDFPLKRRS